MKKVLMLSLLMTSLFTSTTSFCQDKKSRPSPPDTVTATTATGNMITIAYSQPSIKGRTIGKDIAAYGEVWRTGANEATVFEITKDAKIEGKYPLKAGKYGLYSVPGEKNWTIIFNKTWKQWGTQYTEGDDALRVVVDTKTVSNLTEKMTFKITKDGTVKLLWGDRSVSFTVQ